MKNLTFSSIVILTASILFSCSNNNNKNKADGSFNALEDVQNINDNAYDTADVYFGDKTTATIFRNYIQLEQALYKADLDEANRFAGDLAESFSNQQTLENAALQMRDTKDIDLLRIHFFTLTKEIESFLRSELKAGSIYKQYCPMVFDNQGAFWFSDVPVINNPYFGESMSKCGKTEEVISK